MVTFRIVGLISAIWVVGLLVQVPIIQSLTVRLFPAYYQNLVRFMVEEIQHPVTSWGTHSVAAYFYFLLVIFFRQDFHANGRRLSLALTSSLDHWSGESEKFLRHFARGIGGIIPRQVHSWAIANSPGSVGEHGE